MPSLLGSTVAQNYGKMTVQQTYGTGIKYTNFGTRNLRIIRVNVTGVNLTYQNGVDSTAGTYEASLSKFALAVRALQTVAEIYAVFTPGSADFLAIVSDDTANDSEDGVNSVAASGGAIWGDAERIIGENLGIAASAVSVQTASIAANGYTLSWATTA